MLEKKLIPPSLHYKTPNPKAGFAGSPLYVSTRLHEWKIRGSDKSQKRVAAVNSFGIGGTNVDVVLEEHTTENVQNNNSNNNGNTKNAPYLLLVSAKTNTALQSQCKNLADFILHNGMLQNTHILHSHITQTHKHSHKHTSTSAQCTNSQTRVYTKPAFTYANYLHNFYQPTVQCRT